MPITVDETYIKVKGQDKHLYRAVDSTGQTIDFLLATKRNTAAANRFFEKVFGSSSTPIPRVINVDKNPPHPAAVEALKAEGLSPAEFVCASAKSNRLALNERIKITAGGVTQTDEIHSCGSYRETAFRFGQPSVCGRR
jgi:transposase-like protein